VCVVSIPRCVSGVCSEQCFRPHTYTLTPALSFALLIVDSVINLYRSGFVGRGQLFNRQSHLNQMLKKLKELANVYNIAIVLTNQVCLCVCDLSVCN